MPEANETPTTTGPHRLHAVPVSAGEPGRLALATIDAVDALRDFVPLLRALAGGPSLLDPAALNPIADAFAARLHKAADAAERAHAALGGKVVEGRA